MSEKFVTSDTHFGHESIIRYCIRPFENVEEMNEGLIRNWNRTVGKKDIVYHAGDFSMGIGKDEVRKIAKRLNGRIILIKGNHDTLGTSFYRELFYSYCPYGIIINKFFLISHKPLFMNEHMPYVNIHGHMHNGGVHEDDFSITKRHVNVCVENTNYSPISIDNIISRFK